MALIIELQSLQFRLPNDVDCRLTAVALHFWTSNGLRSVKKLEPYPLFYAELAQIVALCLQCLKSEPRTMYETMASKSSHGELKQDMVTMNTLNQLKGESNPEVGDQGLGCGADFVLLYE